jgi:uncharacterized protein YndB with AHSA1/START domain
MNASTPLMVRVARRYPFPPRRVYDAWLDPALARRFLFATPDGEMVRVEIDARVGGGFTVIERRPQGDAPHYGVYLELDPPRRIVFAFSTERPDPDGDRVSIDIAPDGDGCTVTLVHAMAPEWADFVERTEAGWAGILADVDATLAAQRASA